VPEGERQRLRPGVHADHEKAQHPGHLTSGPFGRLFKPPQLIRNHAIWTGRAGTLVSTT
jgi:hypothetical protein